MRSSYVRTYPTFPGTCLIDICPPHIGVGNHNIEVPTENSLLEATVGTYPEED